VSQVQRERHACADQRVELALDCNSSLLRPTLWAPSQWTSKFAVMSSVELPRPTCAVVTPARRCGGLKTQEMLAVRVGIDDRRATSVREESSTTPRRASTSDTRYCSLIAFECVEGPARLSVNRTAKPRRRKWQPRANPIWPCADDEHRRVYLCRRRSAAMRFRPSRAIAPITKRPTPPMAAIPETCAQSL
jgi:hypothetical protein